MAVLPHYSPGYPEWDIGEQPRLLELIEETRKASFPSVVEAFGLGHAAAQEIAAGGVRI